jgi:hypothetical protein
VATVLHRDAQGTEVVKVCNIGYVVVTRREVPGAGRPVVRAGAVISTAGNKDAAKKLAEKMIAEGTWPKRSLRVIRVLNCLE